ncbi:MAG TPA: hypothetical protein VLT86_18510 [Vicinamibacterales bacterium]|nr:hypothetical protein [Vicinamibacterales bacterium]
MRIVIWLIRVVAIMFIVRLVLSALTPIAVPRKRPASRPAAGPAERSGGTLVRDPHCGTYLPATRALRVGMGASAQYFCSDDCRRAWLAANPTAHSA